MYARVENAVVSVPSPQLVVVPVLQDPAARDEQKIRNVSPVLYQNLILRWQSAYTLLLHILPASAWCLVRLWVAEGPAGNETKHAEALKPEHGPVRRQWL